MNSKNKIKYEIGEDIIIENNIMRVARSPLKLKLPQNLDSDFAYLAGYHLGDGYLEDIHKTFKRRGKGGYEIDYADSDIQQLNLINNIIKDKFDFMLRIYKRPNVNLWIARTDCKVLHWFLNKKLELPIGKRETIKIPSWILVNNEFISNFLSGFFDAEGDVSKNLNKTRHGKKFYKIRIQLTQKDKNILLGIKYILLKKYMIKSCIFKKHKQDAYILKIDARNAINVFKEKINFKNPKKKEKLEMLDKEIIYKEPRKINLNNIKREGTSGDGYKL